MNIQTAAANAERALRKLEADNNRNMNELRVAHNALILAAGTATPPADDDQPEYETVTNENDLELALADRDIDAVRVAEVDFKGNPASGLFLLNIPERRSGKKLKLLFHECHFVDNKIGIHIRQDNGVPIEVDFEDCRFLGNSARDDGAGILTYFDTDGSSVGFERCLFRDNGMDRLGKNYGESWRKHGGYLSGTLDNVRVKDCIFSGNAASALKVQRVKNLTVENVLIGGSGCGFDIGDTGRQDWEATPESQRTRPPEGIREGQATFKRVIAHGLNDLPDRNMGQFATSNDCALTFGEDVYWGFHNDTFPNGRVDALWLHGRNTKVTEIQGDIKAGVAFDRPFRHQSSSDYSDWNMTGHSVRRGSPQNRINVASKAAAVLAGKDITVVINRAFEEVRA